MNIFMDVVKKLAFGSIVTAFWLLPTYAQVSRSPNISALHIVAIDRGGAIFQQTLSPSVSIERMLGAPRVSTNDFKSVLPNFPNNVSAVAVTPRGMDEPTRLYVPENPTRFREATTEDLQRTPELQAVDLLASARQEQLYPIQFSVHGIGDQSTIYVKSANASSRQVILTPNDMDSFLSYIDTTNLIVHRGDDLPDNWMAEIKERGLSYLRVSDHSPNQRFTQIKKAADLGKRRFPPRTRILSALPQIEGWFAPYWELFKMNLPLREKSDWQELREQKLRLLGLQIENATKQSVLKELGTGESDVLLLIAHNDGKQIYLSGTDGEKIQFDEIRRLKRQAVPNRTIILITCSAGTVNKTSQSLAETLLSNKLARTIFASAESVSAETLPELLSDLVLHRGELRSTLQKYDYIQIVTLVTERIRRG